MKINSINNSTSFGRFYVTNKGSQTLARNFMQKPEIAAKNALETCYGITNTAGLEMLPDAIKNNNGLYPDDEILEKSEMLKSDGDINQKYLEIWHQVTATN